MENTNCKFTYLGHTLWACFTVPPFYKNFKLCGVSKFYTA